ncbi:hypothetical protein V7S43_011300 [Phytophthora oleae]|uniref:Neutral zinc metallopeptidase, Zn-binding site n=1 Tax=Phytophthora oleae TaxID=2107226 RepID=A0ABD3FFV4_9STRA
MAPSRLPRTSAVLLAATLVATSSAIEFGGQNDITQTAGTVAPAEETPTTNVATGASGFGNFDSPTQWAAPSSNEVPTTAPTVASSGSGWSQPSTPAVYSAGSGQTSGSGPSQTWTQPTTTQAPSGWTPPTAGGSGWTQPSGSGNQGWTPSGQGSGTADQGWSQQTDTSSNAAPPSTGDSSGYEDTLGVDCSSSSEGGASPGYDMSLECSGSDDEGGESPGYDMSLECSGSDEEPPATGGSSNPTPTTAPSVSSGTGDQEASSDTATSAPSIEESTPATSSTSSGTGGQDLSQMPTSSASSSNTESSSNTAQTPESPSNTESSANTAQSATQEGSDATQTDTSTSSGEHASFGKVTSKSGGCVIGDPEKYISAKDVNWIFEHRMGVNQTNNKNWIFDHIVANKGSLNYCVRWDSTKKLSKTVASKFQAMLERQYAAWNRWLIGYGCWPYNEIKVNMVGFAVKEASLLDWTDDSLGTITVGDLDSDGVPQCDQKCYRFYDNAPKTWTDTSGCKGEPFDLSLWPKQGLEGGFGFDWGQEVNLENMLQTIDQEQLHIVAHEIGHGFGLPDFYEEADKPSTDMAPAIMMAGSSMTVTDSDGWMLRCAYESIRDRYNFK